MSESFYHRLPWQLQEVAVSAKGYRIQKRRYGPLFARLLQDYEARSDWHPETILSYREERLAAILERASTSVFYSDFFREVGASWQDFLTPEAFQQLPIITKNDLQERGSEFETRSHAPGDGTITTSGTTGTSLSIATSANFDPEQWAVWWRYRRSHGIDIGTPLALFASTPITSPHATTRFWRHNAAGRETRYSVYHLGPETAAAYVKQLDRERKPWIHGNPSAIALLASLMNQQGLSLSFRPQWVTTGSENLTDNFRQSITSAFGVGPIQHYGLAEGNANFSECKSHKMHIDEDYALVEFVAHDGHSSRVVGTSFSNERTALIRYDTGDLARPSDEPCECGRAGRVVAAMDGRQGDYVTLPSGAKVSSLATPFHSADWLSEGQLYQRPDGMIEIRFVPREGKVTAQQLADFERVLRSRIGEAVPVTFQQVKHIARSSRGKTRLVVSDYDASHRS